MSGSIVVGVDGSETSLLAVRWAAREAMTRGSALRLVAAWEMPTFGFSFGAVAYSEDLFKAMRKTAEDNLADALDQVRERTADVDVTTEAVEGNAAGVLLQAALDTDLLVIGSRGLGGFRDLLLGSVSEQCANHASCPVVIVRHLPNGEVGTTDR
jgi:nucleotide-binding universal stress UspA family protein